MPSRASKPHGRMVKVGETMFRPQKVEGENLIVRKDGVLCTICWLVEPVHAGESGTPLPSLLIGYKAVVKQHPPTKHSKPWGRR